MAQTSQVAIVENEAAVRFRAGFVNPPPEAKPYAWWHWMNGNVDAVEAERDLDWLAEQGIGGVFLFEAGLGAPPLIKPLAPWMSPA
jgi:alpha-L-rhamnosidase